MIHILCAQCVHACKQNSSVKIVKCPRYEKRMDEKEFRQLVNDVADIEKQADNLKNRIQSLLNNMHNDQSIGGDN